MAKKRSPFSSPLVYSTDPFFIQQEKSETESTLPPESQKLKVTVDRKHRAGKVVTLVTGFNGRAEDIEVLCKDLKSFCGTGGSVKDDVIIVQGENTEKIFQRLHKAGYKQTIKI